MREPVVVSGVGGQDLRTGKHKHASHTRGRTLEALMQDLLVASPEVRVCVCVRVCVEACVCVEALMQPTPCLSPVLRSMPHIFIFLLYSFATYSFSMFSFDFTLPDRFPKIKGPSGLCTQYVNKRLFGNKRLFARTLATAW